MTTPFIGREAEITEAVEALRAGHSLVVKGRGKSGTYHESSAYRMPSRSHRLASR